MLFGAPENTPSVVTSAQIGANSVALRTSVHGAISLGGCQRNRRAAARHTECRGIWRRRPRQNPGPGLPSLQPQGSAAFRLLDPVRRPFRAMRHIALRARRQARNRGWFTSTFGVALSRVNSGFAGLCDVDPRLVAHRPAGTGPAAASRAGAWLPPGFATSTWSRQASSFSCARSSRNASCRAEFRLSRMAAGRRVSSARCPYCRRTHAQC